MQDTTSLASLTVALPIAVSLGAFAISVVNYRSNSRRVRVRTSSTAEGINLYVVNAGGQPMMLLAFGLRWAFSSNLYVTYDPDAKAGKPPLRIESGDLKVYVVEWSEIADTIAWRLMNLGKWSQPFNGLNQRFPELTCFLYADIGTSIKRFPLILVNQRYRPLLRREIGEAIARRQSSALGTEVT